MTRSRVLLEGLLEARRRDIGTMELLPLPWMPPEMLAALHELGYTPAQMFRMSKSGAEVALRERIPMTSASILRSGDVINVAPSHVGIL